MERLDRHAPESFADVDDELVVDQQSGKIAAKDDVAAAQWCAHGQRLADLAEQVELARRGNPAQLQRELDEAAAVDAVAAAAALEPWRVEQPLGHRRRILVMGHGFCGGCAASLTGQFDGARVGEGHFIAHWIDLLDEARDKVRAEHDALDRAAFQAMEREGVRVSLRNLRTFPWVKEREEGGRLKLHGAVFSISDGILYLCDEERGSFAPA